MKARSPLQKLISILLRVHPQVQRALWNYKYKLPSSAVLVGKHMLEC